jgi:NAD(P)-dependent dehydrogenase (short-subunit alcohol dehydrogenase family)
MELKDKVVIVTGGANGIGRALCERFAREGARGVVLGDLDERAGAEVAAGLGAVGLFLRCDVTREADIGALVAAARERFGPIDLCCSNAGISYLDGAHAASTDDASWQKIWLVNVMAHVWAARAVLPEMLERGSGYLLNTVSAAGLLSQIGSATYSTTKHAAMGFAESLAISHGDQGIRVSALCPQGVRTNMTRGQESSPQAGDGMLSPEQVAESVVEGLRDERFLILPHPEVTTYMQRKTADHDRWLAGMRRFRNKFL